MAAILGTWNPALWQWDDIVDVIAATARGRGVVDTWSVGNRKHGIRPGDRFFLLKVGKQPRGMVGSGTVLSEPLRAPHWDGTPGKTTQTLDVEFDRVIDPDRVLPASVLSEQLPHTNWKPMSSGTTIDPADQEPLEILWMLHLTQL
jgi:5-methylcytosine-specific restriction protein A